MNVRGKTRKLAGGGHSSRLVALLVALLLVSTVGFARPAYADDGQTGFFDDPLGTIASLFNGDSASNDEGVDTQAVTSGATRETDPDTKTGQAVSLGETASTQYNGRVWVDKTVNTGSIEFTGTDEEGHPQTIRVTNDSDFLVTYSALATSTRYVDEQTLPVDVVFVVDFSNSMHETISAGDGSRPTRIQSMVEALNASINRLMQLNNNTRIGVVGYHTHSFEILPLDHYTYTNNIFSYNSRNNRVSWNAEGSNGQNRNGNKTVDGNQEDGGTNIQAGIYQGMNQLANANGTTVTINGKTVTRIPSVIIMSDSGATYSQSTSNWWAPSGNNTNGNGSSFYYGNGFKAMMTAAYMKQEINRHYGLNVGDTNAASVYTVGAGVSQLSDNNGARSLAEITLNPTGEWNSSTDMARSIRQAWNTYTSGGEPEVTVNDGRRTYTVSHPDENDISGTDIQYNDEYFEPLTDEDINSVFSTIVDRIIGSAQIPTEVTTTDPTTDGYITYTDPIGQYMEIKDIKSLIWSGEVFTQKTQGTDSEGNTTYTFEGDIVSEVYGNHNASEIQITVKNDGDGTQTLEVKIPASAIPLRVNTVTVNGSPDAVQSNESNNAYPLRLNYTVGFRSDIDPKTLGGINGADGVSSAYIDENGSNGIVSFYANDFTRAEDGSPAAALAAVKFTPDPNNPFYFFTESTPLYTDATLSTRATSFDSNATYYYPVSYYDDNRYVPTYGTISAGLLSESDVNTDDGHLTVNEGVTRGDVSAFDAQKTDNRTETDGNRFTPSYVDGEMVGLLGNNGRLQLSYTPAEKEFDPSDTEHAPAVTKRVATDGTANVDPTGYNFALTVKNTGEGADAGWKLPDEAESLSGHSNADGSVTFDGKVTFTEVGTYEVSIAEVPGEDDMMSYDGHTFTYTVNVSANGTQLEATVDEDSIATGEGTFINVDRGEAKDAFAEQGSPTTEIDGKLVGVGDTITYKVHWVNNNYAADSNGASQNSDVTVRDAIPTGTELVEGSITSNPEATNTTTSDGKITWTFEAQPFGAEGDVFFTVRVTNDAVEKVENTAMIQLGQNGEEQDTNTVENPVPGKSDAHENGDPIGEDGVKVGDVLTYTINYANTSGAAATVTVTDTLPASLTYVGVPEGQPTPEQKVIDGRTVLTWTIDGVADGDTGSVKFNARVNENAIVEGVDNTATIQVGEDERTYTTNTTHDTVQTGDLTISKTVVKGDEGYKPDAQQEFTFTVTAKDAGGNALTGSYVVSGLEGTTSITFDESGKATLKLKDGQSATIEGLPEGTEYSVAEAQVAGYTPEKDELTGTIDIDGETAAFTNTYEPGGDVTTGTGSANVQLTKVLDGKTWDGDSFQFTISPVSNTAGIDDVKNMPMPKDGSGKTVDSVTVSAPTDTDADGNDLATFSFDGFTFDTIGTYVYHVKEVKGDNQGIAYDTENTAVVTITVSDDARGGLAAAVSIDNPVFRNIYSSTIDYNSEANGGLNIVKTYVNHDMDAFTFTVKPTDEGTADKFGIAAAGETRTTTAGATMEDGQSVVTVPVLNGAVKFSQDDVNKTYGFTISEEQGSNDAVDYDDTAYTVKITTEDDGKGGLTVTTTVTDGGSSQTYTYTSNGAGETGTAQVSFKNTYEATGELGGDASGSAKIEATKVLTGRPLANGEFTFNVVNTKGNVVSTGANDAQGNITFSAIEYTKAGLIADAENGLADYSQVDGKDAYTYSYAVAENTAGFEGKGVVATAGSFPIVVTVTDNNDGTLKAEVSQGNGMTFRNEYGAGEQGTATVSFGGTKVLTMASGNVRPDIAGKFSFALTGSEGAPMPSATTATNDASGAVTFGDVTFDMSIFDGIEAAEDGTRTATFTYQVTESGTVAGVANDASATKTFTVVATDNGDGSISVTDENGSPLTGGAQFTFTNTYSVEETTSTPTDPSATGHFAVSKELSGRAMAEGEFSFALVDAAGTQVAAGSNDANGSVSLSGVTFTKPGTYEYALVEVAGNNSGITYDTTAYQVTASVTDNGNGTLAVAWALADASGSPVEAATFANTYQIVRPASIVFGAGKTLDGAELEDGQFSFELRDADGTVLQTVKNGADGSVVFAPVEFTKAGTYEYTIAEVLPNDDDADTEGVQAEGVTYDEHVVTATVTVTDNGDGSTTATVAYDTEDGGLPVFANTYTAPKAPEPKPEPEPEPSEPTLPGTGDGTIALVGAIAAAGLLAAGLGAATRRRSE